MRRRRRVRRSRSYRQARRLIAPLGAAALTWVGAVPAVAVPTRLAAAVKAFATGTRPDAGAVAAPDPEGRGLLEPTQVVALVGGAPNLGSPGSGTALYRVVAVDLSGAFVSNPCQLPPNPPGSWIRTLYHWDGTGWVVIDQRCAPALPALPPTPAEVAGVVVQKAPITPSMSVFPTLRGLVGLPVTLTYTGPASVPVTADQGPWSVTATATVRRIEWSDDGRIVAQSAAASATAPANVTFLTSGTHHLAADVTWSGTYVVATSDGVPRWFDTMADVVNSTGADLPVISVVALIE